jgi:hypothetical protein
MLNAQLNRAERAISLIPYSPQIVQKRPIDFLDMNPTVLHRLDRIRDFEQLARSSFRPDHA